MKARGSASNSQFEIRNSKSECPIKSVRVCAYRIPTDSPESDGTLEWDSTTLVLVEAEAAGARGLGYTYADTATATLVRDRLAQIITGRDAMDTGGSWDSMVRSIRNLGRAGICSMAISSVDNALWDLKARILGQPLAKLLGMARARVAVYGSGGFTSYSIEKLCAQLSGWVAAGIPRVKMKVGREAAKDVERVRAAREAIGKEAELFVDANGAYARQQALALADRFAELGVTWFEEPVPSDDLAGLRLIRDRAPAGVEVAAGEYGYDLPYFRRMLQAGAVDVLQADARRRGCLCPLTARRRFTSRPVVPRRRCATSSISTTMRESNICSSTARSSPEEGLSSPTSRGPGSGSSSNDATQRSMRYECDVRSAKFKVGDPGGNTTQNLGLRPHELRA